MGKNFIVEMSKSYPFGQLGETITEDTAITVCKKCHYSTEEEYNIIQHIIHFLKAARHPNLINLERTMEDQETVHLYYQYVPMRLDKWLLDVNEQLISSLEQQMLELAEYLSRSSIKFVFDPESIGLSENMSIKYFISEFVVDLNSSEENLERLQKDIKRFFREFVKPQNVKPEEFESEKKRMQSMSTNGSLSPAEADVFHSKVQRKPSVVDRQSKMSSLSQRVQSSKKRCMEIMQRFRKMNIKQ